MWYDADVCATTSRHDRLHTRLDLVAEAFRTRGDVCRQAIEVTGGRVVFSMAAAGRDWREAASAAARAVREALAAAGEDPADWAVDSPEVATDGVRR